MHTESPISPSFFLPTMSPSEGKAEQRSSPRPDVALGPNRPNRSFQTWPKKAACCSSQSQTQRLHNDGRRLNYRVRQRDTLRVRYTLRLPACRRVVSRYSSMKAKCRSSHSDEGTHRSWRSFNLILTGTQLILFNTIEHGTAKTVRARIELPPAVLAFLSLVASVYVRLYKP